MCIICASLIKFIIFLKNKNADKSAFLIYKTL
nr:MAG TPA: hypothetical protein [Caudoviricetes sp.]